MLNTRTGQNFNANDVINSNDLRKRLISIDSRFRVTLNDTSTNFQYRCEHTYKNVIRLKLSSVEIPNVFYTFMASKSNTTFVVTTTDISGNLRQLTVTIPDGNYTIYDLIDEIQTQFNAGFRDPYGIFLAISYNEITGRTTIAHNGLAPYPVTMPTVPSAGAGPLIINFQPTEVLYEYNYNCGIGYNLGFRQRIFELVTPTSTVPFATYILTGTAAIDVLGDTYCLLEVNDFHTVEHLTVEKYTQCLAKIIIRKPKGEVIYDDGSTLLSNEIIFPSPVDITTLKVRLLDPHGNVLSLNGLDFSFTLEITEVQNTRLYEFYRNYIWLGVLPTVSPAMQGSPVGLLHGRGP